MNNVIKEMEIKHPELTALLNEGEASLKRYFEICEILDEKYDVNGYFWMINPNSASSKFSLVKDI